MATTLEMIELYLAGNSIPMVSKATGTPLSTVRHRLHRLSLLRTHQEAANLAVLQGRYDGHKRKPGEYTTSEETKRKISAAHKRRADLHAVGVSLKPSGYMEITRGEHKGKREHRVAVEAHLGRALSPNEVIHHIDGDKTNNSLDNLQVMTAQEHSSLHARENHLRRQRDKSGRFA